MSFLTIILNLDVCLILTRVIFPRVKPNHLWSESSSYLKNAGLQIFDSNKCSNVSSGKDQKEITLSIKIWELFLKHVNIENFNEWIAFLRVLSCSVCILFKQSLHIVCWIRRHKSIGILKVSSYGSFFHR
jgi:hypothetical protein